MNMYECTGECEEECPGQTICPLLFEDEDYRYDDPDYHESIIDEADICQIGQFLFD